MNCKQVEELLPLYAGRDLDEKRATLVTAHVEKCAACARVANEYRECVQLTEQFAAPLFSESVYAGIRQRVLREIGPAAKAPAWSQTIASLFRPRLAWAIAGVLLIAVSMFAINFIVNRRNDEQQFAGKQPAKVQPETKEQPNSTLHDNMPADVPPAVNTGGNKQQLAGVPKQQRKRSREMLADRAVSAKSPEAISTANNVSPQPNSILDPMEFPNRNSATANKTLRVEIQTKDPTIRIIWFVQQETKPVIPGSKGT